MVDAPTTVAADFPEIALTPAQNEIVLDQVARVSPFLTFANRVNVNEDGAVLSYLTKRPVANFTVENQKKPSSDLAKGATPLKKFYLSTVFPISKYAAKKFLGADPEDGNSEIARDSILGLAAEAFAMRITDEIRTGQQGVVTNPLDEDAKEVTIEDGQMLRAIGLTKKAIRSARGQWVADTAIEAEFILNDAASNKTLFVPTITERPAINRVGTIVGDPAVIGDLNTAPLHTTPQTDVPIAYYGDFASALAWGEVSGITVAISNSAPLILDNGTMWTPFDHNGLLVRAEMEVSLGLLDTANRFVALRLAEPTDPDETP